MKKFEIYSGMDQIYNKQYKMCIINAKDLSNYLKSKIDNIKDYIIKDSINLNVPGTLKEIYEYQNFFLIEKNGEYILLDGFRRLLVFNVPDININVRIYNYNDFNEKELLNLIINLNHTKFLGGLGFYYDRGVCLSFHKLFNIRINNYHTALDGYLRQTDHNRTYWKNDISNDILLERILNDYFISDMRFIEEVKMNSDVFINDIFGVLVYNFRIENPNVKLNSNKFIDLIKNDDSISILHEKVLKYGDDYSAKSKDVINKLTESYIKIFNILSGKKVELTFNEKLIEYKKELDAFKKDKNYIKLTKNRDCYIAERIIFRNFKNNKQNKYKLFVKPLKEDYYDIGYCLVDYNIELVPNENKSYRNSQDFDLYINIGGDKIKITHGYNNYGRGQTYIGFYMWQKTKHNISYEIDLFVDISQKEFKEAKK